jgi:hypothetical protein
MHQFNSADWTEAGTEQSIQLLEDVRDVLIVSGLCCCFVSCISNSKGAAQRGAGAQ